MNDAKTRLVAFVALLVLVQFQFLAAAGAPALLPAEAAAALAVSQSPPETEHRLESRQTPDPYRSVYIESMRYTGTGCPAGSVTIAYNTARTEYTSASRV